MRSFFPLLFLMLLLGACGPDDQRIVNDVNASLAASGGAISATVDKGVVTLAGTCPDEPCKSSSEAAAKTVKGVKRVINNITVKPPPPPPVEINAADDSLSTAVNEIMSSYRTVKATVKDGIVTLTGELKRSELSDLMQKVTATKPKKIDNQLQLK